MARTGSNKIRNSIGLNFGLTQKKSFGFIDCKSNSEPSKNKTNCFGAGKVILLFVLATFFTLNLTAANRFVEKTFHSQALNKDKTYFISYPDGYNQSDTTKKYPVIIFLHGATVNAQDVVELFDSIISIPLIKYIFPNFFKVIFVIPDGSAPPYQGSFYTNSKLYGNFETYIATDLTNEIRQKYKTYNYREKWSIMGHSMGGYGSMKIALKYPKQYVGVAALSGPLHITYYDDILPLLLAEHGTAPPYNFTNKGKISELIYSMAGAFSPDLTKKDSVIFPVLPNGTVNPEILPLWDAENPIRLIRGWNGNPKMGIFLYCGGSDEYKLMSQNLLFSDSLFAYNLRRTFIKDPLGDHVTSLSISFPLGLNFLYGVMDTSQINPNSITYFDIRKNFIYPNPVKEKLFLSSTNLEIIDQVSIYSISGTLVSSRSGIDFKNGISVSSLLPGYYLMSIRSADGHNQSFRFIKSD